MIQQLLKSLFSSSPQNRKSRQRSIQPQHSLRINKQANVRGGVHSGRIVCRGKEVWRQPSPGAAVISAVTPEGEAPSRYQVQSKAYLQANRHQQRFSQRSFDISYRARIANHFQDPRVHWTPTDMVTGKAKHSHSVIPAEQRNQPPASFPALKRPQIQWRRVLFHWGDPFR